MAQAPRACTGGRPADQRLQPQGPRSTTKRLTTGLTARRSPVLTQWTGYEENTIMVKAQLSGACMLWLGCVGRLVWQGDHREDHATSRAEGRRRGHRAHRHPVLDRAGVRLAGGLASGLAGRSSLADPRRQLRCRVPQRDGGIGTNPFRARRAEIVAGVSQTTLFATRLSRSAATAGARASGLAETLNPGGRSSATGLERSRRATSFKTRASVQKRRAL